MAVYIIFYRHVAHQEIIIPMVNCEMLLNVKDSSKSHPNCMPVVNLIVKTIEGTQGKRELSRSTKMLQIPTKQPNHHDRVRKKSLNGSS